MIIAPLKIINLDPSMRNKPIYAKHDAHASTKAGIMNIKGV